MFAIIRLAHSLKLNTIAEGVETAEQLAILNAYGCDEYQGYYFSQPLPVAEFEQRWLAHGDRCANDPCA